MSFLEGKKGKINLKKVRVKFLWKCLPKKELATNRLIPALGIHSMAKEEEEDEADEKTNYVSL